jgi:excisionase family DNA binding protein
MTSQLEWLTVAEAASYLKVGRATLYRWAHDGRIAIRHFGKRTSRIARSDLDKMARPERLSGDDGWNHLSRPAFDADWENDIDAIYDDWRSHYGLRER